MWREFPLQQNPNIYKSDFVFGASIRRWLKIKIKTDIYEIENIGDNLEILIHHDNTIRCKTVRENEVVEFTHLELDKEDKEGDIEVTITKNSIMVKEIGEGGKVISKKHSFLNQKTKIICLPLYLIDLIKIEWNISILNNFA